MLSGRVLQNVARDRIRALIAFAALALTLLSASALAQPPGKDAPNTAIFFSPLHNVANEADLRQELAEPLAAWLTDPNGLGLPPDHVVSMVPTPTEAATPGRGPQNLEDLTAQIEKSAASLPIGRPSELTLVIPSHGGYQDGSGAIKFSYDSTASYRLLAE